ncbi:flagellar biosynthesis protein FlhF [Desulfocastanea catecholica]
MQVRVFEALDMASGLKIIKQELGPDALILSTRTVRNGKLGILGKPMLEITAAVDTDFPEREKNDRRSISQPMAPAPPVGKHRTGFRQVVGDSVARYLHAEDPSPAAAQAAEHNARKTTGAKTDDHRLQNDVNELKDLVKNLAGQIGLLTEQEAGGKVQKSTRQTGLQVKDIDFANRLTGNAIHGDHILSLLTGRGINVETSRTITGFLRQSLTEQELCDPANVTNTIISTITDLIEVQPPVFAAGQVQQRIALVGPTGVGKTTTLAKIAASYLARHSNAIALITIDTYRIAAVEQLKVYGEIMRLPVDVVISPEQLEQAIARHSDKELILIDTAGRSPRDSYCIDELAQFLRPDRHIDKHLVLSAGTRENELVDTIERFNSLGISNTIFTKTDECTNLGILLNIQIQNANSLSYITNGQRVPEDLLEISPKIVAELIMSQNEGSMHD